jgi:N6-adenosine-specific RNA methylase IME4
MANSPTLSEWKATGLPLGRAERHLMWQIGDWWLVGERYGRGLRKQVVTAPGWRGPSYDSCRVAGAMARRFPPRLRRLHIGFVHHQAVASLPDAKALALLDQATRSAWTQNRIRFEVGRIQNFTKPVGGDIATSLPELMAGGRKYRAILADPPWRVWTDTNKRGGSDRHYHSLPTAEIEALPVAAAADERAFLFLWAPAVCLPDALSVMSAWGFNYTTNMTWYKDGEFGVGYYFRMQHELMLLGRRKHAPAHFADKAISSVLVAPRTAHSEKPAIVHNLIERATPGPYVELFGRTAVTGWTVVGNQLPPMKSGRQPQLLVKRPTDPDRPS